MRAYETEELRGITSDKYFAFLPGLQSLAIRKKAKFNTNTIFANLKELKFTRIWSNLNNFNRIIRNHSQTLERLSIDMIKNEAFEEKFPQRSTIEFIKSCKNLKLLSVGCDSLLVPNALGKIEFDHPWTLEVFYKKNDSSEATSRNFVHESEWLKVVFKFPDDAGLFKGENSWDDDVIRNLEAVKNNAFGMEIENLLGSIVTSLSTNE